MSLVEIMMGAQDHKLNKVGNRGVTIVLLSQYV